MTSLHVCGRTWYVRDVWVTTAGEHKALLVDTGGVVSALPRQAVLLLSGLLSPGDQCPFTAEVLQPPGTPELSMDDEDLRYDLSLRESELMLTLGTELPELQMRRKVHLYGKDYLRLDMYNPDWPIGARWVHIESEQI